MDIQKARSNAIGGFTALNNGSKDWNVAQADLEEGGCADIEAT
ncbi:hypothetical protein ACF3M1_15480 [Luteimonas sp. WGS1318]